MVDRPMSLDVVWYSRVRPEFVLIEPGLSPLSARLLYLLDHRLYPLDHRLRAARSALWLRGTQTAARGDREEKPATPQ